MRPRRRAGWGRRFGLHRLIAAPITRRRSRAVLTVSALALAATLVTCVLTVYGGVERNLNREFRGSGANIVVTAGDDATLLTPAEASRALQAAPGGDGTGVLYAVGTANDRQIVLAGADLQRLAGMESSWRISGRVPGDGEAWLGVDAARLLGAGVGQTLVVGYGSRRQTWHVTGLVDAGTSEDNQVLAPLAAVQSLTGLNGFTTVEIRAPASGVNTALGALQAALPGATVRPVRQIAASEGAILLRTRGMLWAMSGLILLTVGLCLAAALTTLAIERRRDISIMKALGGSEHEVLFAFVGEAAILGLIAAVIGMLAGAAAAGVLGRALFAVWLLPAAGTLAATVAVTMLLAVLAALAPWPIVRAIAPGAILRGN